MYYTKSLISSKNDSLFVICPEIFTMKLPSEKIEKINFDEPSNITLVILIGSSFLYPAISVICISIYNAFIDGNETINIFSSSGQINNKNPPSYFEFFYLPTNHLRSHLL